VKQMSSLTFKHLIKPMVMQRTEIGAEHIRERCLGPDISHIFPFTSRRSEISKRGSLVLLLSRNRTAATGKPHLKLCLSRFLVHNIPTTH
jgi:hypothetical protein